MTEQRLPDIGSVGETSASTDGLDPELAEAYGQCAQRNILAALNPKVFFGYFSVCADAKGYGGDTTYPGLDWGQSAEALLWLGRTAEVLASWDYVNRFQRGDGLVPFAILPSEAGRTINVSGHPLIVEPSGAVFRHWVPGNPLYVLANVTFLQMADAIHRHTHDDGWLQAQAPVLRRAADWLMRQVEESGLVPGGGFYIEFPARLRYDGVAQCCTAHALRLAAQLLHDPACDAAADRITECFRRRFWAGDHCVEYIHPERGPISHHGLTDVDWAAVATRVASDEQIKKLWPQLRDNPDFLYGGMPSGISTRPETYEDWEMQRLSGHDLAAMGRVWYLEAWARWNMGDRAGLLESLRRVARAGRNNDWYWHERYYSQRTGELGRGRMNTYCEYPANLIRIVNRFVLAR